MQRNRDTEISLLEALRAVDQGYLSLIGPPGSGKSTLLQVALATEPSIRLLRYLAYAVGHVRAGCHRHHAGDRGDVRYVRRSSCACACRVRNGREPPPSRCCSLSFRFKLIRGKGNLIFADCPHKSHQISRHGERISICP